MCYTERMAGRRRIDEDAALRAVVEGTVSETGADFYRALVTNLSRALDTHGAWVTEYDPGTEQLRALAFWMGGKFIEDYVYVLPGTPCETAINQGRMVHVPDRVVDLYPDAPPNPLFSGTVSYLGVPMFDDRHRLLGHVAVVDTRPMPDENRLVPLFQIFASRAAAELLRLRLESDVREREAKLSRLIDSAMDAIVEMDRDLAVTMMNPAAEKLFAVNAARVHGQRVEHLVGMDAAKELATFVDVLERRRDGDRHT